MLTPPEPNPANEGLFSWRRIKILIIGIAFAVVAGLIAANLFTYFQYGGTMFDRFLEKEQPKSAVAGKLAFDKSTKYYLGIIRSEGRSARRGNVYYIEQPGGNLIEVSREGVEVREPQNPEK